MVIPKTTYFREEENRFKGKIIFYAQMDLFDLSQNSLPLNDWKRLYTGCLGPIVQFGGRMKVAGQLIHFFLMNEITTVKNHEMWFNISGNVVRFSLVEYAAVTGLVCTDEDIGEVPEVNPHTELRMRNLTFDQLVTVFLNERDSEKKLRWAHVLVVDGVLMPKRKVQEVDSMVYSLSSDMELFSKYPWGRLSYAATIESLRHLNRSNHNVVPGSRFGYNLFGYPLAFQVWILETFPLFSKVVNVSAKPEKSIPYCARWVSTQVDKIVTKNQVEEVAADRKLVCVIPTFSDLGELKHVCFDNEVIDATFDSYIQGVMSKDKNNTDLIVREVLDDLDDFALKSMIDCPKLSKRKFIQWHPTDDNNKPKLSKRKFIQWHPTDDNNKQKKLKGEDILPVIIKPQLKKQKNQKMQMKPKRQKKAKSTMVSPCDDLMDKAEKDDGEFDDGAKMDASTSLRNSLFHAIEDEKDEVEKNDGEFNDGVKMDASTSLMCSPFPKNASNPESITEETVHASHKEVVIPSWARELVESSRSQQKAIKYIQWKVTDHSLKIEELSKGMKTLLSLLKPRVDDPGCAEASTDLKDDDLVVEEKVADKKEKELKENEMDQHLFDSLLIDCCGEVGDLVEDATELGEKREETIAPETEVVTEKVDEVAPETEVVTERVDEVAPETEFVTEKVDEVAPETEFVTEKVDEVAPETEFVTEKVDEVAPETECVTEKVDEVATETEFVTEKVDMVQEAMDMGEKAEAEVVRRSRRVAKESALVCTPYTLGQKKKNPPRRPKFCFHNDEIRNIFFEWYNHCDKKAIVSVIKKLLHQDVMLLSAGTGSDYY